jgi:hypothetical protein
METEKLKDYFTRYPHNDEVFENNGVLFHNRGAADSFGDAKETVRHTRAKVMVETPLAPEGEQEPLAPKGEQEPLAPKGEQEKEVAIELLKATDVETLDYNAMKALAKDLQLTTADQKKETLIAALIEYKTTLTVE